MDNSFKLDSHSTLKRPHFTFRLREDFIDFVRKECIALNCSQGVFFETLISQYYEHGFINKGDPFFYDSDVRRQSVFSCDVESAAKP